MASWPGTGRTPSDRPVLLNLLLIALALFGAPLFVIIAASALWGFYREGIDLSVLPIEIFAIAETPILLAIPLFTFAGYLLSESQAPKRLVRFTQAVFGWMPGGLAVVTALVNSCPQIRRRAPSSPENPKV